MGGSVNSTTQSLDQYLQQRLSSLESEFLQFKNRQPIGGDVIQVQSLPGPHAVYSAATLTVPSGYEGSLNTLYSPLNGTLTLWNFLVSVYIDPVSFDNAGLPDTDHLYPNGSALTVGQHNFAWKSWVDWATSSDTSNARRFVNTFLNLDSVPHSYYVLQKAYLPNLNQV